MKNWIHFLACSRTVGNFVQHCLASLFLYYFFLGIVFLHMLKQEMFCRNASENTISLLLSLISAMRKQGVCNLSTIYSICLRAGGVEQVEKITTMTCSNLFCTKDQCTDGIQRLTSMYSLIGTGSMWTNIR